jgi:hypothetical protein
VWCQPRGEQSPNKSVRYVVPSPRGVQSPEGEIDYTMSASHIFIDRLNEDSVTQEVAGHLAVWQDGLVYSSFYIN